jgi:hypothetical protein
MRVISALIVCLALAGCRTSRTGGEAASKKFVTATNSSLHTKMSVREIPSFSNLSIRIPANVDIVISPDHKLVLEAEPSLGEQIETTCDKNGTLTIASSSPLKPQSRVKIAVSTPSLERVEIIGFATVNVRPLNQKTFSAAVKGAGSLTATGELDSLDLDCEGACDAQFNRLICKEARVELSGRNEARIYASKKLDVHIKGNGIVRLRGEPPVLNEKIEGAGAILKDK